MKIILTSLLLVICYFATGQNPEHRILEYMADQSEVVVFGKIVENDCVMDEAGVLNCMHTFGVDSILKGNITLMTFQIVNYNSTSRDDLFLNYEGIYFHRDCFAYTPPMFSDLHSEDCLEKYRKYALFLIPSPNRKFFHGDKQIPLYKLIDRIIGVQEISYSFLNSFRPPK